MILPTKGIRSDRALLTVGADILSVLRPGPLTLNQCWSRVRDKRANRGLHSPLPFWWFALALDCLYATDLITLVGDVVAARGSSAEATER